MGDVLLCLPDPENVYSETAVKLILLGGTGQTGGHAPADIESFLLGKLKEGKTVKATVTGSRENKGRGLQVPAQYTVI